MEILQKNSINQVSQTRLIPNDFANMTLKHQASNAYSDKEYLE